MKNDKYTMLLYTVHEMIYNYASILFFYFSLNIYNYMTLYDFIYILYQIVIILDAFFL